MAEKAPISEKEYLTIKEAAQLTGIGQTKLRHLAKTMDRQLTLHVGNRTLLRKTALLRFLETVNRV